MQYLNDTNIGLFSRLIYGDFGHAFNPILDRIRNMRHDLKCECGIQNLEATFAKYYLNRLAQVFSFSLGSEDVSVVTIAIYSS
jgi:hypothetical protein